MFGDLRMPPPGYDDVADALGVVVLLEVRHLADHLGVSYRPSSVAPRTFDQVRIEYHMARLTGTPFRVPAADTQLFRQSHINHALHFWHDLVHLGLDADFSLAGRRQVTNHHLVVLRHCYGLTPVSPVARLLRTDSFDRHLCWFLTGHQPLDEQRFAGTVLGGGVELAIDTERYYQRQLPGFGESLRSVGG